MSCYPFGGTGARTTPAVPSELVVTVQVTVEARPVFLPYVLATIFAPSRRKGD